jgi:hypothetical protein
VQRFGVAEHIATAVWRFHFRIPEPAYWAASVAGLGLVFFSPGVGVFFLVIGLQGVGRWEWHRRKSRALVIARFSTLGGTEGRASRVQELVMTRLQDSLPEGFHFWFHAIPAVVGPADRSFAVQLQGRLGMPVSTPWAYRRKTFRWVRRLCKGRATR